MKDNIIRIGADLVKAIPERNQQMRIGVIASDESLDLQNEYTLTKGLADSLTYLAKCGKFNDNHSSKIIGEIDKAVILRKGALVQNGTFTPEEIPESEWDKPCVWVEGWLYPACKAAKNYWTLLKSGAGRVFGSLQGAVLKRAEKQENGEWHLVNSKCFVSQVAITGQPINSNARAKALIKSLSPCGPCGGHCGHKCAKRGGECLSTVIDAAIRAEAAKEPVYAEMRKGLSSPSLGFIARKALTTGAGIVAPGDTGGTALRSQDLEGAEKKRKKKDEALTDLKEPEMSKAVKEEGAVIRHTNHYFSENPEDSAAKYASQLKSDGWTIHDSSGANTVANPKALVLAEKGNVHHSHEFLSGGPEKIPTKAEKLPPRTAKSLTDMDAESQTESIVEKESTMDVLHKSLAEVGDVKDLPSSLQVAMLSDMELTGQLFSKSLQYHGSFEDADGLHHVYTTDRPETAAKFANVRHFMEKGNIHQVPGYAQVDGEADGKAESFHIYNTAQVGRAAGLAKSMGAQISKSLSDDDLRCALQRKISPSPQPAQGSSGDNAWVSKLYSEEHYCIVEKGGKYYKAPFTIKDGEPELGEWEEVENNWVPKKTD